MTTTLAIDRDRIVDFCRRLDSDVYVLVAFEPGVPWTLGPLQEELSIERE